MGLKGYIILFLILLLIPIFLGEVSWTPFSEFFQHPSWEGFKSAFIETLNDDYTFYKDLIVPWIEDIINWFKEKITSL